MLDRPKRPVYVKLPWIEPASQVFTDKILSSVTRYFYAVMFAS